MGLGDDIMATAYIDAISHQHPKAKFAFGSHEKGINHWSEVFWHHPKLAHPGAIYPSNTTVVFIDNYPGHRPSIDYSLTTAEAFKFRSEYRAVKGKLHFSMLERIGARYIAHVQLAGQSVFIEPNVKGTISADNKAWFWDRWQAVVNEMPDVNWVQLGKSAGATRRLDNCEFIQTPTFREACAIMQAERNGIFVGTDGGLHHAAAAFGMKAVVLWGGYSSASNFGYEDHVNIQSIDALTPCGRLAKCEHCERAMQRIEVEEVVGTIFNVLNA